MLLEHIWVFHTGPMGCRETLLSLLNWFEAVEAGDMRVLS